MSFATLSEKPKVVLLSGTKRQKKSIPGPETKHQAHSGIARKRVFDKEAHEREVLRARMEASAKFRQPVVSNRPPSPPAELTPAQAMRLRREGPEKINPVLVAPKVYVPQTATPELLESPFKVNAKAGFYADEKTRLARDRKADSELRAERNKNAVKKDAQLHKKSIEMARRDDERYQKMADDKKEAQEKVDKLRESGKAQRNRLSMPYNPITLAYADGVDGQRLKHVDDSQKYRASVRQRNLQQRMSSSHNPITGTPQHNLSLPDRPVTPEPVKRATALAIARHKNKDSEAAASAAFEASALPQRRYARKPNPYLDESGLATKYGAHYEKHKQFKAQTAATATTSSTTAPANGATSNAAVQRPAAVAAPVAAPAAAAAPATTPMPITAH